MLKISLKLLNIKQMNLAWQTASYKFSIRMWDINAMAIYYLRPDNVLRIPCQNSWRYIKPYMIPRIMHNLRYGIIILLFQKCMKQLPVKDLVCLFSHIRTEFMRRSAAYFIQSVQANLHMNYFLENTCCELCQAERYAIKRISSVE